jgi:hypothetical protein
MRLVLSRDVPIILISDGLAVRSVRRDVMLAIVWVWGVHAAHADLRVSASVRGQWSLAQGDVARDGFR